jgi:hypothetical protein
MVLTETVSSLGYINRIYNNISSVRIDDLERLLHDVQSAGVIIPLGEGRSKGALSIAVSEMAKMRDGKIVVDRGDIGFPGREISDAALYSSRGLAVYVSWLTRVQAGQSHPL